MRRMTSRICRRSTALRTRPSRSAKCWPEFITTNGHESTRMQQGRTGILPVRGRLEACPTLIMADEPKKTDETPLKIEKAKEISLPSAVLALDVSADGK